MSGFGRREDASVRARRLGVVVIVSVLLIAAGAPVVAAATSSIANDHGVIAVVGDSNTFLSAGILESAVQGDSNIGDSYTPVFLSRSGSGIRTADCLDPTNCATYDYWKTRLGEVLPKLDPDAFVVDLGINDALEPGTIATRGYAGYDAKIDWFMGLLPAGKPVFWTNLPCQLEPTVLMFGCNTINAELVSAAARWPNLTIVDWASEANSHPEYMNSASFGGVHYTATGYAAWTGVVLSALNVQLAIPNSSIPFGHAHADTASNAHDRGVIALVGDSVLSLDAEKLETQLQGDANFDNSYTPAFSTRADAGVRTADCSDPTACATYNYWQTKLGEVVPKLSPDAFVVDLGLSDTAAPGAMTTPGYVRYGAKLDWFMGLLPAGKPVFWINLPCEIMAPDRQLACNTIDTKLVNAATRRWPNLTVIDWASEANSHPEYINQTDSSGIHYTGVGNTALTQLIVSTLDAQFPEP